FVQPSPWWSRYTVWLWGAGALALAVIADTIGQRSKMFLGPAVLLLSMVVLAEALFALYGAKGVGPWWRERVASGKPRLLTALMLPRSEGKHTSFDQSFLRHIPSGTKDICRTGWRPGTNNANLDGIFAQLSLRPRVHVIQDDGETWPNVRNRALQAGCETFLLLRGSPVLEDALADPSAHVESAIAFDPMSVVRLSRVR